MPKPIPNEMPTTLAGWNELCENTLFNETEKYEAEVANAKVAAETQWNNTVTARREAALAELKAKLDGMTIHGPDGDVPVEDYDDLWNAGVAEIDKQLAQEKQQAIESAVSFIQQPRTLEQIQTEFAFGKPQEQPVEAQIGEVIDIYNTIYKVGDTYWDVEHACYVSPKARGAIDESRVVEIGGPQTVENLRETLKFYGQRDPRIKLGPEIMSLEEVRTAKLAELATAFDAAQEHGKLMSSAGFEIDANETANRNIQGLITAMEDNSQTATMFCDANNQFHNVTLGQLKTMQLEVITYGQNLYQKKWTIREAINAATTKQELVAIAIDL